MIFLSHLKKKSSILLHGILITALPSDLTKILALEFIYIYCIKNKIFATDQN